MPVVVPSAPEVQETTRMLQDAESVSSQGWPSGTAALVAAALCAGPQVGSRRPSWAHVPERPTEPGLRWGFGLALALLDLGFACLTSPATAPPTPIPTATFL